MKIEGWKYYVHAAIPSCAPHEKANKKPIEDGSIWELDGNPLLARWTSEWDCGHETEWWYVIKDTPFDITALKSKRRYEINKGNKYFDVREISPSDYGEELYQVTKAAYETYPASYRPNINHDSFVADAQKWEFYKTYGAFSIETEELCGYACLLRDGIYVDFRNLKARPSEEKLGLNAAIVNKILEDHKDFLSSGGYICDGTRSIQHETAFQDYLEKYFGFRKAFCKLNIVYKQNFGTAINILYPARKILAKLSSISAIKKINALMRMEEIRRSFE